jgi:hypothetical protein
MKTAEIIWMVGITWTHHDRIAKVFPGQSLHCWWHCCTEHICCPIYLFLIQLLQYQYTQTSVTWLFPQIWASLSSMNDNRATCPRTIQKQRYTCTNLHVWMKAGSGVRKLQKMTNGTRERQAYCIFVFRFQIAGWHSIKNSHHLATERNLQYLYPQ